MTHAVRQKLWAFLESLYSNELTAESPKAETPSWIRTPLLNHQRTTLAAALALEKAKCNGIDVEGNASDPVGGKFFTSYGILGDRVGSGKSLTALALMQHEPPPTSYTEYITRNNYVIGDGRDIGLIRTKSQLVTKSGIPLTPTTASILIVPHALIDQWSTYIRTDTTLRQKVIKRKADATDDLVFSNIDSYDIVLVSSTMWATLKEFRTPGTDRNLIKTLLWRRVFIDEADSIAFSSDWDELHGLFYWFITASWLNVLFSGGTCVNIATAYPPLPTTPPTILHRVQQSSNHHNFSVAGCRHMNIVRRMSAGFNLGYNSVYTGILSQAPRLVLRCSDSYIASSFVPPAIKHTVIQCTTPGNLRVLDSFISPDMMERLHAGDVGGALAMVGMSSHSEEELIGAVTASWTRELENARKTYEFKKTIEYSSESAKAKALEVCEAKIVSLESRISAIEDRIKRAKEHACPICYSETENPAITPCCQQVFCFKCMCESLKRVAACPLCRERIPDLKAIRVLGDSKAAAAAAAAAAADKKGKRETAIEFMRTKPDGRFLVFSSYDASFSGLDNALTEAGIPNAALLGSQARISKLLREFKEGVHKVLFLNARNMGAGLNIDCASHVLLFHKMSSELEKQIIGRAVRLGRTEPLEVIHLLHDNEVRENVLSYV